MPDLRTKAVLFDSYTENDALFEAEFGVTDVPDAEYVARVNVSEDPSVYDAVIVLPDGVLTVPLMLLLDVALTTVNE